MTKKVKDDSTGCEPEKSSDSQPSPEPQEPSRGAVTPVREKIGEERGNLRRRSEWFRQRSGDPE
jgi:hypothetical protein